MGCHAARERLAQKPAGGGPRIRHQPARTPRAFPDRRRIPIHNNSSERRLRVVALGRKNYLLSATRAGRNIAGLYSLVGSCIANGVEPTEYLIDVLPRIADAKSHEELDVLLPDPSDARRWADLGRVPATRTCRGATLAVAKRCRGERAAPPFRGRSFSPMKGMDRVSCPDGILPLD
jgi:hypothetical protein